MLFTAENTLLVGSILLLVSIIAGKAGYRFGVPALLLFPVVGMLFGSDGLGLQFHSAKGAQFIGMVALGIILFSDGMNARFTEIEPILSPDIVLSTLGVLLTALFTELFIWWLSSISWTNIRPPLITSLLLASATSSTDSASIFAILRSQKMNLKHNLHPILELESESNDSTAYMLAIVLIQSIQSSGVGVSQIALFFVVQFIMSVTAGYLLGKLAILTLNKLNIDDQSLYPILLLSFIFFTFSITDLMKSNGYLVIYIAGMMVDNNKVMHRKEIYTFMDELMWLFQIIMFLCLGLLVNPHEILEVAVVALLIGIFMIVIGWPFSVFLCPLPFGRHITPTSKLFVSWVGLRDAVPIVLAIYSVAADVPGAGVVFNIVFFITVLSLIIQGTTISRMARLLGLSTPMEKTGSDFRIELPEEISPDLRGVTVTQKVLDKKGDTLENTNPPQETLVIIVKRGNEYLIPNGTLELHVGNKLLLISERVKK